MEKLVATLTLILMIRLSSALPLQSETHIISETKKITRLHFYLHDVLGGDSPTDWTVAQCKLSNVLPSLFGKVLVLDNLVTSGPGIDSGEVGRMQGAVAMADLRETALAMLINFVFTKGEFEGSTLSILGRNPLAAESREASIVAGTGAFRMATGYVITSTYYQDPTNVHSVFEYTAVVYHSDPNVTTY